ncbi:MAG: DNA/RNA nuclease SfsA [Magnetococcales bacterium]|nr:DNA/RNA nuclease SfsA [Magnetococcales bacterium]
MPCSGRIAFCSDHASTIDPAYAATLRQVVQAGVEVLVYCCAVGPQAITLSHAVPWALD